jgi:predicted DNA-binding transcriptional regulator YafY
MDKRIIGTPTSHLALQKFIRMLSIVEYLKANRATVDQLSRRFNCSTRTIHRYIWVFDEAGLQIEKDFNGQYFIIP